MENKNTIIILDDHSLFLKGVTALLYDFFEHVSVLNYTSIAEMRKDDPDFGKTGLLISDIQLPNEDVFELLENLKVNYPDLPVLVVTMHKKITVIKKCEALGINGFLLKDDDEYFQEAVQHILEGGTYYSEQIKSYYRSFTKLNSITSRREEEVIKLMCKGLTNKEIAGKLYISVETVKSHKKNIKSKFGFSDTSELIKYANEHFIM